MKKLILVLMLGMGLYSFAQNTCLPPSYFFNSKTRISGNGGVGAQYRFNNVLPGINAYITITKLQNATIDSNNLDNQSSYPLAWQPYVTFPSRRTLAGDSSYIDFKVEFKTAGSSPVLLPQNCLAMTIVDCDGNGANSYREFAKISLPAKPMGVLNSTLSVFQDEHWVMFKSGTATFNNIDTNIKAAMGQVSFPSSGVSSYSMRVGVIGPITANTTRQFSFYFKSFAGLVVALSVDLISFKAAKESENVNLNWISSKEDNFSHYELYKSYNGTQFEFINTVNGQNSINGINQYVFTDYSAFNAQLQSAFYRLKMVDKDGKSSWSHTVFVGNEDAPIKNTIELYPNPSNGVINVSIENIELCEKIIIKDIMGKTLLEQDLDLNAINQTLDVSRFESGIYALIIVNSDGTTNNTCFVKK